MLLQDKTDGFRKDSLLYSACKEIAPAIPNHVEFHLVVHWILCSAGSGDGDCDCDVLIAWLVYIILGLVVDDRGWIKRKKL